MTDAQFSGFPAEMYEFWEQLEANNNREWFQRHKAEFESAIKTPMRLLCDELEAKYGDAHVFRINRDIRFSKDKSPYKLEQGAVFGESISAGFYFHVDADGIMIGCGYPELAADQLERFRAAVAADTTGAAFETVVRTLRRGGFDVGSLQGNQIAEPDLKRVPKPYPPDHPRGDFLRLKKIVAVKTFDRPAWLSKRVATKRIAENWEKTRPLVQWMTEHVGESSSPRRR